MKARRSIVISATAVAMSVALAIPAAATYYITGWQTNSGWNSLDGCSVSRIRGTNGVSAEDYLCSRDVGVRGKGTLWSTGQTFESGSPYWGSHYAIDQTWFGDDKYEAMKVYHGNH